jgi:hypothetical protein
VNAKTCLGVVIAALFGATACNSSTNGDGGSFDGAVHDALPNDAAPGTDAHSAPDAQPSDGPEDAASPVDGGMTTDAASAPDAAPAADAAGGGDATSIMLPAIVSVSFNAPNTPANGRSQEPVVDHQGRYVAFTSFASNLIANYLNNGAAGDIYLRDTCNGAVGACSPSTLLVSVSTAAVQCHLDGAPARDGSISPSMSADARFIAFDTDLCFGSSTFQQIALRDTCLSPGGPLPGCTPTTTLISANAAGRPGNNHSRLPRISPNGRFIAFISLASDLTADVGSGVLQAFLHDSCMTSSGPVAACTPSTTLISKTAAGPVDMDVLGADVSDDGSVIFDSASIVLNAMNNGLHELVYVVRPGSPVSLVTAQPGMQVPANGGCSEERISRDGRYIILISNATNLAPTTGTGQALLYDSCVSSSVAVGGCIPGFVNVSSSLSGSSATGETLFGLLSETGRFLTFQSSAMNLTGMNPPTSRSAVFARDTCNGAAAGTCTATTVIASVDGRGNFAGSIGGSALSGDGRFIAFYSLLDDAFPANQIVLVSSQLP